MSSTLRLLRIFRGAKGETATEGVELTDAEVLSQTEAGPNDLGNSGVIFFTSICRDYSGNLYGTDYINNIVFKVCEGGKVSWVAGKAGVTGNNGTLNNVDAQDAMFNDLNGITCDKSGTIYIADSGNHQIRTIKGGKVNVLAGAAGISGFIDGNGTEARFNYPSDVTVDKSGLVYVADLNNHAIRKITNNGDVLTIAGNGSSGDAENVRASKYTATFNRPFNVSVDSKGNVFVLDLDNNKVKKITPNGWVYLHSGSGSYGASLGTPPYWSYTCTYGALWDLDHDDSDNLYILDFGNPVDRTRVLRLDNEGRPSEVADFDNNSYLNDPSCICTTSNQTIFIGMSS